MRADDVRQGAHARKVMASYQSWLGEGPELAVLRLLGFFDRPADEKALGALLKPPAIPGLTEFLTGLSPAEWRTLLAKLRGARLLAGEDPHHPGHLDAHPLVREYFGDQLQHQRAEDWQEGNRRLYEHYRALAPPLPENVRDMEPLFLAVIYGCQAGRFRDALHEVYLPRIQRGDASFAAKVLGTRGALLSVLAHFFEHGRWGCSPTQTGVKGLSKAFRVLTTMGRYAVNGIPAGCGQYANERPQIGKDFAQLSRPPGRWGCPQAGSGAGSGPHCGVTPAGLGEARSAGAAQTVWSGAPESPHPGCGPCRREAHGP